MSEFPADRWSATPRVVGEDELAPSSDLQMLLDEIEHHRTTDVGQGATRTAMLAFGRAHPDALTRSCASGHFTTSALVVERGTQRFVVLHHAKLRKWLQPGGHADGEANTAASALREAQEETGLEGLVVVRPVVDLDIHLVEPPGEQPHLHLDLRYLVLAPPGAPVVGNHESTDIRWATLGDLDALGVDDGLRRLAVNGLALARAVSDG